MGFANVNATNDEVTCLSPLANSEFKTAQDKMDNTIANMEDIPRKSKSLKLISEEMKNKCKKFTKLSKIS